MLLISNLHLIFTFRGGGEQTSCRGKKIDGGGGEYIGERGDHIGGDKRVN